MQFYTGAFPSSVLPANRLDITGGLQKKLILRTSGPPLYRIEQCGNRSTECRCQKVREVLLPMPVTCEALHDCAILLGKPEVAEFIQSKPDMFAWLMRRPERAIGYRTKPNDRTALVRAAMEYAERQLGIYIEPPSFVPTSAPVPAPRILSSRQLQGYLPRFRRRQQGRRRRQSV